MLQKVSYVAVCASVIAAVLGLSGATGQNPTPCTNGQNPPTSIPACTCTAHVQKFVTGGVESGNLGLSKKENGCCAPNGCPDRQCEWEYLPGGSWTISKTGAHSWSWADSAGETGSGSGSSSFSYDPPDVIPKATCGLDSTHEMNGTFFSASGGVIGTIEISWKCLPCVVP
jgi:hypothetical protein